MTHIHNIVVKTIHFQIPIPISRLPYIEIEMTFEPYDIDIVGIKSLFL